MQPLQRAAGVLEPALGDAAGLGRWFVGGAVLLKAGSTCGDTARQPPCLEPCQYASGQPWACHGPLQGQMQPLQREAGVVKPALVASAGLGRWFVGGAVLRNARGFHMWRRSSATTAHRSLPVCEWRALSMPWGTATANAVDAVCSRCEGACTGGCGRAGQVVCGGCIFSECWWSFPDLEAPLSNHSSAQSPSRA